jgi:hypothetical protein
MKMSVVFSKYMEGQQVSAYDKNDNIIDGVVRIKEGKKYILSDDSKVYLMTEMKKIKQVGRRLNEEAEAAYADSLKQFSDYYQNTFDTEKVEKANDDVKEKIINQYADNSDDSAVKANKEAFIKDALTTMNTAAAAEQIEAGNSTVDVEIEKLKKEQDDGELQESLFDNRKIQKAILREMEVEKQEGAEYLQPRDEYGLRSDLRADAVDYCTMMIDRGVNKDTIIQDLQLEYEISKDEAEKMYNDIAVDVDWEAMGIVDDDFRTESSASMYDEIENKFEEALNNIPKELAGSKAVVHYLAETFNLDAEKALKETNNIGDAVMNLFEQAKANK